MHTTDLSLLGRERPLLGDDYKTSLPALGQFFNGARVLVVGGAGSIGSEVVKLLATFPVAALAVVDASENNLTELTRDFRSSIGYIEAETLFLPLDALDKNFDAFLAAQKPFDIVLNFSAMKHVRSEKDPWSLMRMVDINIFAAKKLLDYADRVNAKKYFCVSTDKAQNPGNLMGATKRIMECYLKHGKTPVSTARFANVAFSDGSLLYGFERRFAKNQPLSAPNDIRRYFLTGEEAGMLCLLSIGLGQNGEIFFPRLDAEKETTTFAEIAVKFLAAKGYEPMVCISEDAAREAMQSLQKRKQWPCYFFESDTTGEKHLEEFHGPGDIVSFDKFKDLGVISGLPHVAPSTLGDFESKIAFLKQGGRWTKTDLVSAIEYALPDFQHEEKGKYLDGKM